MVNGRLQLDRGFIGGVMVSLLASSAIDCGFIGGVIVSVCGRLWVHRWCNG